MIIEIRGTGTHNKGAELMLCAIQQYFSAHHRTVRLCVESSFGPYSKRGQYGLFTKLPRKRLGRSAVASLLMTDSFRRAYGLVSRNEIDAVIDASGFLLSDHFGSQAATAFAEEAALLQRQKIPLILMPQAFGPFENKQIKSSVRRVVDAASLVFARDSQSLQYLENLVGLQPNIRQSPDFTMIAHGIYPSWVKLPDLFACIVPNQKMLSHAPTHAQESYLSFLVVCVTELQRHGIDPVLLYHEPKKDSLIASLLERQLKFSLPVVEETDPIFLKGVIGRAHVVVGSRYHALVSSLSQSVPAIAVGWSHKYEMLFSDYSCERFAICPTASREEIAALIEETAHPTSRLRISQELREKCRQQNDQVVQMFREIEQILKLTG